MKKYIFTLLLAILTATAQGQPNQRLQQLEDFFQQQGIGVSHKQTNAIDGSITHQMNAYRKKFERYDLVILDELGYISFDKEGSEILFNLLSNRNDRGSIIITSNLVFERWDEIFKDPILTGAIVDRLAHKAHVLDMSGDSYRIKETLEWLK